MPLAAAITDLEQLKSHPAVARLLAWNPASVVGAKFDREEMTIWVDRTHIREVCALLRDDADCAFNFLSDVTCVDWYPGEPRFEVVYHLLSIPKKERVRLKVRLDSGDPAVESLTLFGRARIILSAKCLICLGFDSMGILTCAGC